MPKYSRGRNNRVRARSSIHERELVWAVATTGTDSEVLSQEDLLKTAAHLGSTLGFHVDGIANGRPHMPRTVLARESERARQRADKAEVAGYLAHVPVRYAIQESLQYFPEGYEPTALSAEEHEAVA